MANPRETVSIILPVYNAAAWLGCCLDSILRQTRPELEVLLVNDGSADASPEICRDYAARDNRIVFIDQRNQGPSTARNTGIERASGTYLAFVDADDFIEPDAIETLAGALEKCGPACGWALCGCHQFGGTGKPQNIRLGHEGAHPAIESLMGFARGDVKIMTTFASLWNKLYLAEIIRANAIRFGATCPGTDIPVYPQEDFFFNISYLHHIENAMFIDRPLYHYRVYQTNLNAVRKYRPHALELHQEVYGTIRKSIWGGCTPEERRNFNRHYLDKTLIILAILCRDNPIFDAAALKEKIATAASLPEITESLADFAPHGSQDNALLEALRQGDVETLYQWARAKGNLIYGEL